MKYGTKRLIASFRNRKRKFGHWNRSDLAKREKGIRAKGRTQASERREKVKQHYYSG
jgi:hypothetical protein